MEGRLKILIVTHQYYPIVGGVPEVAKLLLEAYLDHGHETILITSTISDECGERNIIRRPNVRLLLSAYWNSHAVIMIGPSVTLGWPLFFIRKKCLISHQAGNKFGFFQKLLVRKSVNLACSRYLASKIGEKCFNYPNPYNSRLFDSYRDKVFECNRDFIYLGRLVEDKGVDILIKALHELRTNGSEYTLTIVGTGSAEEELKKLVSDLELDNQITFSGVLQGEDLAEMVLKHRVGVIPSRWQEPFGIVALEYAALGLRVVGSNVGGLPEAIGPSGLIFSNGNYKQLAGKMQQSIESNVWIAKKKKIESHLKQSHPSKVALNYLQILINQKL